MKHLINQQKHRFGYTHLEVRPSKQSYRGHHNQFVKQLMIRFVVTSILVACLVALFLTITSKPSQAAWFDQNWRFRKAITIPSHTTAENNVYVTPPTFDATDTNKFQSDCGDLRFTQADGKLLRYYVVDCDATANIHVQFETLPAGASIYYMYYGNASAPNGFTLSDFATAASGLGSQTAASEEKTPGPIGIWNFDEGQGSITYDSTQANNNATLSNTTWNQATEGCRQGNCLFFNGTSAEAVITNTSNIDLNTGLAAGFTIGAWVKVNSDGENNVGRILSKGTSTYLRITNDGTDGKADLEASLDLATADATVTITDGIILNTWQYISFAYTDDGDDEISVYIDGKLQGISTNGNGAPAADTADLSIGGTTSSHFHGFIDVVHLYAYQLSDVQMNTDAKNGNVIGTTNYESLSNGLVGYWKLDETSWTNDCATDSVLDSSGQNNNGRSCPASSGPTGGVVGKFASGGSFDGTDDVLGIYSSGLDSDFNGDEGTLSAWVKVTNSGVWTDGTTRTVAKIHDDGSNTVFIQKTTLSNRISTTYIANGVTETINHDSFANTDFFMVTVTWSKANNTVNFYIDGTLVGSSTNLGDWDRGTLSTTATAIGGNNISGTEPWSGLIDDVRVYTRPLDPTEIKNLAEWAPGPLAYWKLDEGTGTTTNDASGNGYTATLTGDPSWDRGKFGNGMKFGANDAYIVSNSSIDLANKSFSIGAWVNRSRNKGEDGVVSSMVISQGTTSTNQGLHLGFYDGYVKCGFFGNDLDGAYMDDKFDWYHIACTYDAINNTRTVYLNGVLTGLQTGVSADYSGTGTIKLGGWAWNTDDEFQGSVDDAFIYNYVRTPEQIMTDANGQHPIGGSPIGSQNIYWRFDEGQGTTANSALQNKRDGTLENIASPATSTSGWTASGKINKAITFDGSNDRVALSYTLDEAVDFTTDPFTLSAWVYMTTAPGASDNDLVIGKWDATNNQRAYRLILKNDDADTTAHLQAEVYDESAAQALTVATPIDTISPNTWYQVALTYNGGTAGAAGDLTVFLDGKNMNTNTANASFLGIEDLDSDFSVGDYDTNDSTSENTAFTGKIDEVQVYNSSLAQDQMAIVYNANASLNASTGQVESAATIDGSGNPPIAHIELNERTGTTTVDISGNNNTLTLENGGAGSLPDWRRGKNDQAIYFSNPGNADSGWTRAKFADDSFDTLTTGTISFWFKPDDTGDNFQEMFYAGDNSGSFNDAFEIGYRSDTNQIEVWTAGCSSNINFTATIPGKVTDWHHLSYTIGASGNLMYIDGVRATTSYSTGTAANECFFDEISTGTTIYAMSCSATGTNCIGTENYVGYIDDFKLYDYARTASQVAYDYNRGAPYIHWKFDECQGSTLYDSSGNGITGTINTGNTSGSNDSVGTCGSGTSTEMWNDGTIGKFNGSLGFDGSADPGGDYIKSITSPGVPTRDFTYTIWYKPANISSTDAIVVVPENTSGNEIRIFMSGSDIDYNVDGGSTVPGTNDLVNDQWYHIALTRTGSAITLYLNGKIESTSTDGDVLNFDTCGILLGVDVSSGTCATLSNPSDYLLGQLDDFRVYHYGLSQAQVLKVMNENAALRFGPVTGSP